MKLQFKDIINSHQGKTAYVVANGPSTKGILGHLDSIKSDKENNVVFVCNEIHDMMNNIGRNFIENINPDFWVLANSQFTIANNYKSFNLLQQNGGKLVYADSVDLSENVDGLLKIDYLPYDQRHFDRQVCPTYKECCRVCRPMFQHRITIQEELQNYTGRAEHYGTASTVALHMLALAILVGCKRIFLSGIDLNYTLGYFDRKTHNSDSFSPWLNDILNDFRIIGDSAVQKNIEIVNMSGTSPLKTVFKTAIV